MNFSLSKFPTNQKEKYSQKELESEAAQKHSLEELEAKNQKLMLLEKRVKELEEKLQLANATLSQKVIFISPTFSHTIILLLARERMRLKRLKHVAYTTLKCHMYHSKHVYLYCILLAILQD